jgi:hypothetical protein
VEDSKFEIIEMSNRKFFSALERCLDESNCVTSRTLAALSNMKVTMAERSVCSQILF